MWTKRQVGALAILLSYCVWTGQSAAEGDTRFHLGLEASLYNNTSVDGSATIEGTGGSSYSSQSSSVKFVSQNSQTGLPGAAAVNLGLLLGDHFDLGSRFVYSTQSSKLGSDSSSPKTEMSAFELTPYFAYLAGSRGDTARFTIGALAGIGSGSTKTTITGTGGSSSTSSTSEDSLSLTRVGAFLGLRAFASDTVSIDPMAMLLKTSATFKSEGIPDVSLTGTTFLLNLGVSLWTGGGAAAAAPVATAPAAATTGAATSESNTPPDAAATPSDRVTLSLGDDRAVTFVLVRTAEVPTVQVVLRDVMTDTNTNSCRQITLHAPNHDEVAVDVTSGFATSGSSRFPILKTKLPVEQIRFLVSLPVGANASAPDHWIDVCGRRWEIPENARARLKAFFDTLPAAPAAAPPAPTPPPAEPTAPASAADAAPATAATAPESAPAPVAAPAPNAAKSPAKAAPKPR